MSEDQYEEFTKLGSMKIKNGVHLTNLARLIRVRNIVKNKFDKDNDFLGLDDPKRFKETKNKTDFELTCAMKNMGPPNFLKTKFQISTIEKCKNVDGLFFGSSGR
jgi:hypothetical protein